jgi:hypothetical protein
MTAEVHSYFHAVLLATHSPSRPVDATRWRWRRLTVSLLDPYRPELHYMRGPGPKWRQKHPQGEQTTLGRA